MQAKEWILNITFVNETFSPCGHLRQGQCNLWTSGNMDLLVSVVDTAIVTRQNAQL